MNEDYGLYNNNSIDIEFSSDYFIREGNISPVSSSSEEVVQSSSEEITEEGREEEEERVETSSEYQQEVVVPTELTHIDKTLNSFFGLFVAVLVLVGIGLVIRFIWRLLDK